MLKLVGKSQLIFCFVLEIVRRGAPPWPAKAVNENIPLWQKITQQPKDNTEKGQRYLLIFLYIYLIYSRKCDLVSMKVDRV